MRFKEWLYFSYVLFATGMLLLLGIVAIHEYGHVLIFNTEGVKVASVALLGWHYNQTTGEQSSIGWTQPTTEYDETPHKCWDALWQLNFTCWGTKLW